MFLSLFYLSSRYLSLVVFQLDSNVFSRDWLYIYSYQSKQDKLSFCVQNIFKMAAQITHIFQLPTALRGYHVYSNTEDWAPHSSARAEQPPRSICCCGQTSLPGNVPREISRHVWYAIEYGAYLSAEVQDPVPRRSPLEQGGLEILRELTVSWEDFEKLEVLRKKISSITFYDYQDDSREILRDMGVEEHE